MRATAYAQCRQQIDGSWAPDPSWQCQQPGDTASGSSTSTPSTTDDTSSGNTGSGSPITPSGSSDPSTSGGDSSSGGGPSQAATIGDCTSTSPPSGWDGVASTSVNLDQSSLLDRSSLTFLQVLRLSRQRLRLRPKCVAMGGWLGRV